MDTSYQAIDQAKVLLDNWNLEHFNRTATVTLQHGLQLHLLSQMGYFLAADAVPADTAARVSGAGTKLMPLFQST